MLECTVLPNTGQSQKWKVAKWMAIAHIEFLTGMKGFCAKSLCKAHFIFQTISEKNWWIIHDPFNGYSIDTRLSTEAIRQ